MAEQRWRDAHPEERVRRDRERWLKRYGLTIESRDAILREQSGLCPICGCVLGEGRLTHVDHDHRTGKVRGLLCRRCNRMVGVFRDDPMIISDAVAYLRR